MRISTRFSGLESSGFHGKEFRGTENASSIYLKRPLKTTVKKPNDVWLIGACGIKFRWLAVSNPKKHERMGTDDNPCLNQPLQGHQLQPLPRSPFPNALFAQTPKPILLCLPAQVLKPSSRQKFCLQTFKDRSDRMPKPAPTFFRPCRMHSAAIRTPPTLHPKALSKALKIPRHIPMPPQPPAPTFRAPFRLWPFVTFFFLKNFLDRNIQIQDHKKLLEHGALFLSQARSG
jgi:hypothetical protein